MLKHFPIEQKLIQQNLNNHYRSLTTIQRGVTPIIHIGQKTFINFSSNDYLGLAQHTEVVTSLANACQEIEQVGSGASHLITGHHQWHDDLAKTLADATGYPSALTFSTGYMANVAILQALCQKDTLIFSDKLNHASIVDGGIISRAKVIRFPHQNYQYLEQCLQQYKNKQKLIITDHVFSMDGTQANLTKLHQLCQHYECALVIDDAHGFALPYQAKSHIADIYMGTLGKAIGTFGAFVASSHTMIDYLINTARPFIYTTALPPALAKASQTAVNIAFHDSQRHARLMMNISQLVDGLIAQGWQVGIDNQPCQTAIVPVIIGDSKQTLSFAKQLQQQGFWVSAIRPPTVPQGTARLRFCVSSEHHSEHIHRLLLAMQSLRL